MHHNQWTVCLSAVQPSVRPAQLALLAQNSFLSYIVLFPLSETVLKGGHSCSGTSCSRCGMACFTILLVVILITFTKFTCSFVVLSKLSSN